jgi:hypothetical protein
MRADPRVQSKNGRLLVRLHEQSLNVVDVRDSTSGFFGTIGSLGRSRFHCRRSTGMLRGVRTTVWSVYDGPVHESVTFTDLVSELQDNSELLEFVARVRRPEKALAATVLVPVAGRSRWDQGLNAAEMKRYH